ncbi:hypothetical protein DVH24_002274 [Malus domestica]|uniref:Uncharacterized protein n=1 Tax=Malus domestica TaxID=3750 RepID=A0A498I5H2_MALDO|nr:hypothetical protein DVH24_002274 [Malus domestica]
MSREDPFITSARPASLDCTSVAPAKVGPLALIHQPQRLSSCSTQLIDGSEEEGDVADSHEDHALRPFQCDDRGSFLLSDLVFGGVSSSSQIIRGDEVVPIGSGDLAGVTVHTYAEMLFGRNLPTEDEIGDPPMTVQPADYEISIKGPNLDANKEIIHRISSQTAADIGSHIQMRISKYLAELISVIDILGVDFLLLRVGIAELMCNIPHCPGEWILTRIFGSSLASVSSRESNPMMGDPLGSSCVSSHKQNREGVVGAQREQYRVIVESSPGCGGGLGRDHEAFLELIGFRFHRNFEVKRVRARVIP